MLLIGLETDVCVCYFLPRSFYIIVFDKCTSSTAPLNYSTFLESCQITVHMQILLPKALSTPARIAPDLSRPRFILSFADLSCRSPTLSGRSTIYLVAWLSIMTLLCDQPCSVVERQVDSVGAARITIGCLACLVRPIESKPRETEVR